MIWAAGVAGSPLGAELARGSGAALDRAGRSSSQPDLSLAGHPEISVIGDLAAALSHGPNGHAPVPGVSPAAKQMGRTAAANIVRRLRGEATRPFRYRDYGNLATVGRKAAIVELAVPGLGTLRFSGLGGVAVLAVRAHLLPDRLSQPADGHGRLGLGVLHVRTRRARRRRAGVGARAAPPF